MNKEIRPVHGPIDDPCPRMVYIHWEKGELRAFPNPVHIHYGEGLQWVPLGNGEPFEAEFKRGESPFMTETFDDRRLHSGLAIAKVERLTRFECKVTYGKVSTILEVAVEPATAVELSTKTVTIHVAGEQLFVTPPNVPIRKLFDQVEWRTQPQGKPFSVDFNKNGSPFASGPHFDHMNRFSGAVLLGTEKGPYKYSVTCDGITIDPGVDVEDP